MFSCHCPPEKPVLQLSKELVNRVWEELFSVTRRTNTSVYGDVEPKPDMKKAGFELYLDDDRLEEKVKVKHTWFTSSLESCIFSEFMTH